MKTIMLFHKWFETMIQTHPPYFLTTLSPPILIKDTSQTELLLWSVKRLLEMGKDGSSRMNGKGKYYWAKIDMKVANGF